MPETVGKIPEFTQDEPKVVEEAGTEEVKEAAVEEIAEPEKETPAEPPAAETPVSPAANLDTTELNKAVVGLQTERAKLLKEISELKGQRREIKQEKLFEVESKIEELKDVNPEDVSLVEKILRSKGYVTKEETNKMFYEAVKQEELEKFLDRYPEYKQENDRQDINWTLLQREFSDFAKPANPRDIGRLLEKAHRNIIRVPSGRDIEVKKQQVKTAGVGAGGVQRSSSVKQLDSEKRKRLEDGGWSKEDIERLEKNQS